MAAPTKTTRKAWYCRKGRADRERIDRLIAARREREARIAQSNLKNHSYFSSWQRQTEWESHSNGPLKGKAVRIPKTTVPYDLDYTPKFKEDNAATHKIVAKLKEAKEKFKSKLVVFTELDQAGNKLREEGDKICYQIESLLALKRTLKDKQESFDIKRRKVYYCRFAKDRFRSKIFVICEQLSYYKVIIECLRRSSSVDEYIEKEEREQLNLLISSSLEIINFFMKLYQQKNCQLIPIYNEEAEKRWHQFEESFEKEKELWYDIADNVMESHFMILKCKLEDNLCQQEAHCDKKSKSLEELNKLASQFEQDVDLFPLLDLDIEELAK